MKQLFYTSCRSLDRIPEKDIIFSTVAGLSYENVWNCTKRELLNNYFSIFLTIYAFQNFIFVGRISIATSHTPLTYLLYYTILYYTFLYYTIPYYTILYYIILYYLCYAMLYYTILYYTILYYTLLYYTILYLEQKVESCLLEINAGK